MVHFTHFHLPTTWSAHLSFANRFKPAMLLGAILIFLHQTGAAQPCSFSVSNGSTTCGFNFTPNVSGVDGYLLEHLWSFGDGSSSDVATPIHTYASSSGSYVVTHTVWVRDPFTLLDIPGSPFVCTQTVSVSPSTSCQLCPGYGEQGSIYTYQVRGCTVKFQGNLPSWYNYSWNYGDGTYPYGTGSAVVHTYNGDGIYNVSVGAQFGNSAYRCTRAIKVDCTRPSSEFTWSIPDPGCGSVRVNLVPAEQSAGATYGWWIDGHLVATGLNPNLFPNGINLCELQQNGGIINVSLVVQLNGESGSVVTHAINFNSLPPAIYIGTAGTTTNLTDYASVLPGSSYCGPCKIKVNGIVTIDKDFEFCGAEVEFAQGNCGLDVPANKSLRLTGGARLHGCDCLWRGIKMLAQSSIFVHEHSVISDAAYAIDVKDMSNTINLDLNGGVFLNNYIGVRLIGTANFTAFTQNLFTASGALKPDCGGQVTGTYSTVLGYAGMSLNHVGNTLNLPNDNNQNIFSRLAIGIISQNGTFSLDHTATFESMNNCSVYQAEHGGTGVYFLNDAAFTAIGNDFKTDIHGIWGETSLHTQVFISENTMNAGAPNVARGVRLVANAGGDMDGEVSYNLINVDYSIGCLSTEYAYGIGFYDFTNASNQLHILGNTIRADCGIAETHGILVSAKGFAGTTPSVVQVDVDDNIIHGYDSATGIKVESARKNIVHDNDIDLNGSNFIRGIEVDGAALNIICSNNIVDNGGNDGIRVGGSNNSVVSNNTMTGTNTGAFFHGDCYDSYIGCNIFNGPQHTGLFYENNTVTGNQINTGNAWYGTFTFKARMTLPQLPASNFYDDLYVVPPGPSAFNPGNTQSYMGTPWFDDSEGYPEPDCSGAAAACSAANRPALRNDSDKVAITSAELTFTIAPNPNSGACTLMLDQALEAQTMVRIVSSSGSWVHQQTLKAGQYSVEVTDLAPGVYFIALENNGVWTTPKKVVVF